MPDRSLVVRGCGLCVAWLSVAALATGEGDRPPRPDAPSTARPNEPLRRPETESASARQADCGGQAERLVRGEPMDLNAACPDEIELLPGIGPTLAARIARERRDRGGFRSLEELEEIAGIGPRTLERMRPFLVVGAERGRRSDREGESGAVVATAGGP
ncbi:MAG: helix-hairpin-helix domain-containing protein [Myxococcales bacterium]|nr:helix-hairpin-helix domain-containing protein [Myxococcales bacterium]